jgi:hypothetical protein
LLTENEVISAVCDHLAANGFKIVRTANTKERGPDIVAKHPDGSGHLWIEAKGETSARHGSAGFGKPFTSAQVPDHVGAAFYKAACLYGEHHGNGDSVALAFPDTVLHRKHWKPIKPTLDLLGITTYLVQKDRSVLAEDAETAH